MMKVFFEFVIFNYFIHKIKRYVFHLYLSSDYPFLANSHILKSHGFLFRSVYMNNYQLPSYKTNENNELLQNLKVTFIKSSFQNIYLLIKELLI